MRNAISLEDSADSLKVAIFAPCPKFGADVVLNLEKNKSGVIGTSFKSLKEMPYLGNLMEFDAFVIQSDCGTTDGLEIAQYIETFLGDRPIVYIRDGSISKWSKRVKAKTIRCILWNSEGIDAIGETTMAVLELLRVRRNRAIGVQAA